MTVDDALHAPDDSPKPLDLLVARLHDRDVPADEVTAALGEIPPFGPFEFAILSDLVHGQNYVEGTTDDVLRAIGARLAPEFHDVPADPTLDEDEAAVVRIERLIDDHRAEAHRQLVTARTGDGPSTDTVIRQTLILEAAIELEARILALVPGGRDRSIALTAVEDALMRANRSFFAPAPAPRPAEAR